MRSPLKELMSKEIKKFFHAQLDEHELILHKTKLTLEKDFIKLVNICVKSLKKKKKIKKKKKSFFLEMEEAPQILSI